MTSQLTPREFVELVNREDVRFKIITQYRDATCKHQVAPPLQFANIIYEEGALGEIYLWFPGVRMWKLTQYLT